MNSLDKILEIVPDLQQEEIENFTESDYAVLKTLEKEVLILVKCKNTSSKYLYFYDLDYNKIINVGLLARRRIEDLLKDSENISTSKIIKKLFSFVPIMNLETIRAKKLPTQRIAIFRSDEKNDEIYTLCYILGIENKLSGKLARIKLLSENAKPIKMTVNYDRIFKYTLANIPLLTKTWT